MNAPLEIIIHRESYLNWELLVVLLENLGWYEYRITPPGKASTRPNSYVSGIELFDTAAVRLGKRHLRETAHTFVPFNLDLGGDA